MAKKTFLVNLDLATNELQNAAIQNLSADPANLKEGLIYYNTATDKLRICDGAVWSDVGKDVDLTDYVTGFGGSNSGDIPVYTDTSGKTIGNSGTSMDDVTSHITDSVSNRKHLKDTEQEALNANSELTSANPVADKNYVDTEDAKKVTKATSSAANNIMSFENTTGGKAKDSGIKASDVTSAIINKHSHSNKTILDGITDVGSGEIITDDERADGLTSFAHVSKTNNPHSVTKAQVGLSNVNNTSDAAKPISTAQATENAKAFHKDGSVVATGNFDLGNKKINNMASGTAGQDAVTLAQMNLAIDSVTGGVTYQEGYNAGMDLPPLESNSGVGIKKGWMYAVTDAGSFYGVDLNVGNSIIANKDVPSSAADWTMLHGDLDHASETKAGIIELATTTETNSGNDDARAVTPLKLKGYVYHRKLSKTDEKAVPSGASPKAVTFAGMTFNTGYSVEVRDAAGDEYQFRVTTSGSTVTFASNVDIPAGLTAYVTGTITSS